MISTKLELPARAKRFRVSGFTLVELMVALVAGLIVSAAALSFFFSSMKSNGEYVQSTRLTQELRNTLDLITRDLRRAGYDDDGLAYVGNPHLSPFTPICIATTAAPTVCVASGASGDCVVYAYDRTFPDGSATAAGTAGTLDLGNGEVRALRMRSRTVNGVSVGVIEYARSEGTTRPACGGASPDYSSFPAACDATSLWCPLSDPTRIDVSQLEITNRSAQIGVNPSAVMSRKVDIKIVGRLAGSTEIVRDAQTSLKVRSDCMRPAIANCNASP